ASTKMVEDAVFRHVIPAGEPYLFEVKQGQTLRLLDLEGNQAVDTLFYRVDDPRERYDPQRTLRRQNSVYLTTGSVLY
ncbi:urea carboxylase-associated family protein, partial [Pectobacterium atrosepticum]|uniref:urea carboxylase-associated family protein n=1 Tax=Pectobacterium atrosepticum TaxID=29471 RepID=UPI00254A898A